MSGGDLELWHWTSLPPGTRRVSCSSPFCWCFEATVVVFLATSASQRSSSVCFVENWAMQWWLYWGWSALQKSCSFVWWSASMEKNLLDPHNLPLAWPLYISLIPLPLSLSLPSLSPSPPLPLSLPPSLSLYLSLSLPPLSHSFSLSHFLSAFALNCFLHDFPASPFFLCIFPTSRQTQFYRRLSKTFTPPLATYCPRWGRWRKKFVPSLGGVVFLHIDHVQN